MALACIYIFTVVLTFSGIGMLKIPAVFFGICYLPGLFVFIHLKRGRLSFEDFVLAFPCSLAVSGILTAGLLYYGADVQSIGYIIYAFAFLILIHVIIRHKEYALPDTELGHREIVFLGVAFLTTLLLSVPVVSERIAISAHGFHHSTIVTQILNGIFPPENPGLGGTTLSYHWGYHAFVAVISFMSDFHPLRVISVLNIMSLLFILCIAYRTAKHFDFPEGYCYLMPLALIGLMRADAVIFFINKLISGNLMVMVHASLSEMRPLDILQNWVWGGGAPWFDRRLFFMNKFYNANTMPLGILLCMSYFLLLLIHSEKKHDAKRVNVYPVAIGFVTAASCLIYPPLAIIPLLHAPLWTVSVFFLKGIDFRTKLKEAIEIAAPYVTAVIIIAPYLLSVSSIDNEPAIKLDFWDQSIRNMTVFWLPTPLICYGAWIAIKKNSSRKIMFLLTGTFLCLILSTFTRVALWNSGKFTFVLAFFYALYFLYAASGFLNLFSNRRVKNFFAACIVVFPVMTPVLTEASYLASPWFYDKTYSFSGRHIILNRNVQRNEAYAWIRNNTSPEALIMLTYVEILDENNIAQNSTYEPAAITERNLFIVKDWYTFPGPEYTMRNMVRKKLVADPSDPGLRKFFTSLNRPVYLLVEDRLPSIYLKEEIFNEFPDDHEGLSMVYSNESQKVYRVTLD